MANIEFFDRTMLEAMSLLAESRRYLTDKAEAESQKMDLEQGLANSMETMRLVARLTQVPVSYTHLTLPTKRIV